MNYAFIHTLISSRTNNVFLTVQRFSFMTSWMNNTLIKTLTKMSTS